MKALIVLAEAGVLAVLGTALVALLYVLTEPEFWLRWAHDIRRAVSRDLYRFARQAHLRKQECRSNIAWVVADWLAPKRATRS